MYLDILLSDFNQLDSDEDCRKLQSTIIQKVDQLGGNGEKKKRFEILTDHTQTELVTLKRELFTRLRNNGVFVLEKGAIEAYYPEDIGKSGSKPQHAFQYRAQIRTRDDVIKCCYEIPCENEQKPELEVIFGAIFG